MELKALNAAGPCTWPIAKGTLPGGSFLSPDGAFGGESAGVGNYPLIINLTDGKNGFEGLLVLIVNRGNPPLVQF